MSKGSKRRPPAVSPEQFKSNWERIFGPRKSQQPPPEKKEPKRD